MKFKHKRWLIIANSVIAMLMRRERAKEDLRVKRLTRLLIVAIVLLLASLGVIIYLIVQTTGGV